MKWLISLVEKVSRLWWSEPAPSLATFKLYLVRTGDYEPYGVDRAITEKGWRQAEATGKALRERIGDDPVIFMGTSGHERTDAYNTTLELIRNAWGTNQKIMDYHPVVDSTFMASSPEIPHILGSYLMDIAPGHKLASLAGVSIIHVINGTTLRHRILSTPGPDVTMDGFGPAFGSAHEFEIKFSIHNGRIAKISREAV
jgi:hypothetical protein